LASNFSEIICGHFQPDITAPGVDILAAWTAEDGPTRMTFQDKRVVKYNIFSGTSMSSPHVSAAAVLLKARYPTWSPAAIRSALMTSGNFNINIHPILDHIVCGFGLPALRNPAHSHNQYQ
jgi:subtilisin family serine protease